MARRATCAIPGENRRQTAGAAAAGPYGLRALGFLAAPAVFCRRFLASYISSSDISGNADGSQVVDLRY